MTNSPDQTTPDYTPARTEPAADAAPLRPAAANEPAASLDVASGPAASLEDANKPAASLDVGKGPAASLDVATFDRILEPRGANRLPLGDGTWHQLARAYVTVRLISVGSFFLVVLLVALALSVVAGQQWVWVPAAIVLVITAWTLVITPRQARATGYQLRDDDLVFRRGILWQRMVAVPYGRMQLVDITHGPLDRAFGIAQLKLVTAAASTGVVIPGLKQDAAQQLRDTLVEVAETRRTGL